VLGISPGEQSQIDSALARAKAADLAQVQRSQPTGDVVAEYTIQSDPILEQGISNDFSAAVRAILGPERADLSLVRAWDELRSKLAPPGQQPLSMTIRRLTVDNETKLSCEVSQGSKVSRSEVRYAHYPSTWFLTVFPGGWQAIAQREGFDLPTNFR
jgi:hypothetical protein